MLSLTRFEGEGFELATAPGEKKENFLSCGGQSGSNLVIDAIFSSFFP